MYINPSSYRSFTVFLKIITCIKNTFKTMSEVSEQFLEQIQDLVIEEEELRKKNKRNFIISNICIVFFAFFTCLSIYFITIDFNKEPFIPVLMVCSIFTAMSIYYAIIFGRKYCYRERDCEIARRDRPRTRVLITSQNEEFEEESNSRSSPADLTDPATAGPSNLPQTESSTMSEQTSTQESSETDSTKNTFITTAIIEHVAVARISGDALSATEGKIASKNEDSKPSTSSQPDTADCLTVDADPEGEIGMVRHRKQIPE